MEDISGVILNWFNPQQQQHRYSITIKLKHMRPSCYSRCKQKKKKTENSGYDFIRGHVISVAFCSMFLNKTKKNYHNLSCADTLFITFFLKWRASHFSKTNLFVYEQTPHTGFTTYKIHCTDNSWTVSPNYLLTVSSQGAHLLPGPD